MQELSRLVREGYGQDSIARIAKTEIENSGSRISIIDGVRRLEDIGPFLELPNFFLIYVDADVRMRYERIVQRAENSGDAEKSYEAFLEEEQGETEVSIQSLRTVASFHLKNETTEADFMGEIDQIIEEILV